MFSFKVFSQLVLFFFAAYMFGMTFTKNAATMNKGTKKTLRILTVLSVLMLFTGACSSPTATPKPKWVRGEGCTLYITSPVGPNGWSDIMAIRYDKCPEIVYDSVLVK